MTPVPGTDASVSLTDGRQITYRRYGPPDGYPLLALHGTPGSRLKFASSEAHAIRLGLNVIAIDRWGYGGSDAHRTPSLRGFADDISRFADTLGLDRFAVLGVSGGGPFAAALAACLGRRVAALALFAPVGPIADETDREISTFHRFCFGPLAASPRVVRFVFSGFRWMLQKSPARAMRIAMSQVPPADKRILATGEHEARLARAFIEGLRPGPEGPVIDLGIFGRPWGVPLSNATTPARLWIGTADLNVPISAAHRLATRLPGCTLTTLPDEGHLWIAQNYGLVLDWVAETAKGEAVAPPR